MYSTVKAGYAHKMGTGVLKRWQKKWMILDHGTLAFGKTEESPGTLERLKVQDCWDVSASDDGTGEYTGLIFDVELDSKVIPVRVTNTAEKDEWVAALKDSNVEVERATTVRHVSQLLSNPNSTKIYSIASDVIETDDIFDIGRNLGSGNAATVYAGKHKLSGREVAIKKISKRKYLTTERAVTTTRREISIMKKLTTLERAHPHIVQLIAVLETKKHLCLLQELVDGGDLADDVLERDTYAEPRAGYVMQCLTSACQHMHKHGVIHRDLKPENVLVRRGVKDFNVKVCDFGLSNVVGGSQDMLKSKCGTMLFMAPEMLARTPYDESVDVWSLGIIMYIMLSGNLPFYAEDYDEFIEMLESTPVYFPDDEWGELSDESKGLLRSILVLDPKARPTTESILGNSWVMSNCNLKPWLYGQETDPRPDDDHRDDGRDAAGGR